MQLIIFKLTDQYCNEAVHRHLRFDDEVFPNFMKLYNGVEIEIIDVVNLPCSPCNVKDLKDVSFVTYCKDE